MNPEPCLSVVIPCYNEVSTVGEVVSTVLDSPWVGEVVIVDDGSTDGTPEILASLNNDRIQVILQPKNQGKGAAIRTGFSKVTRSYVIIQDADLEYDPADYGTMLGPLLAGRSDVVYGSRFISDRPHRVLYYWHSVGNRFLTTLSNMTTNLNLTDMETCFKAFRREVVESFTITEDRFGLEPELTARVAAGGWRVFEVGISYYGRTYDEGKKINWKDGVSALRCILKYAVVARRDARRYSA
jgi:glycosyltransferase involved in cell wall biosynthesis